PPTPDESRTRHARLHNSSPPGRRPGGRTARGSARSPARRRGNLHSPPSAPTGRPRAPTSSRAATPSCLTQTPHTTSARLHSSPGGSLQSSQASFGLELRGSLSLQRPAHSLFVVISASLEN